MLHAVTRASACTHPDARDNAKAEADAEALIKADADTVAVDVPRGKTRQSGPRSRLMRAGRRVAEREPGRLAEREPGPVAQPSRGASGGPVRARRRVRRPVLAHAGGCNRRLMCMVIRRCARVICQTHVMREIERSECVYAQ